MARRDGSRITQRHVAELAGVSQATVSLVLNGKVDATTRIPEATRRRVLEVIRETTYVADPAARRLAGVGNNIIGVFTYEHAFPIQTSDFYTPLLTGVEAGAEAIGCDLLMFTSAPVIDGQRRIFHENNRLRLADGCLLLGRDMNADELSRLVDSEYPFVAIGRREAADGRVPYIGVDYVSATATLARMAIEQGHTKFFYVRLPNTAESTRDRLEGLRRELDVANLPLAMADTNGSDLEEVWQRVREQAPTVLFVGDPTHAQTLYELATDSGVSVPADLSIVALGEQTRRGPNAVDFTRLDAPGAELGSRAIALLDQILNGTRGERELPRQVLLDCTIVGGSTLTGPNKGTGF